MANTFYKIASVSLSTSSASISFTSIPQTFTDLVIKWSARLAAGGAVENCTIRFNGTTSNYSSRDIGYVGPDYGVRSLTNQGGTNDMFSGYIPTSGHTANTFGNNEIYIPNYTSSNFKSISVNGVSSTNSASILDFGLIFSAGLLSNTAAITDITIASDTGYSLAANSTATLYGISKS
jgi:hypothetical protein